jgi:hypothetical protein
MMGSPGVLHPLTSALAEVRVRRLRYPLGSGQAEEIALAEGVKPALRQLLAADKVDDARRRFEEAGFHVVAAGSVVRDGENRLVRPEPGMSHLLVPLFVGKDPASLEEAASCELAWRDVGANRRMGALLGYPDCCVEGFVQTPPPRTNLTLAAASWARTTSSPLPRLNGLDLAIFHFVPWTPCSYACHASVRYADTVAELVARTDPEFVRAIDAALAAHRLVALALDDVQLSIRGERLGDVVLLEEVWPTSIDRHPSVPLPEAAAALVGKLVLRLRASSRLRVMSGRLELDGSLLDEMGGSFMLIPFGR